MIKSYVQTTSVVPLGNSVVEGALHRSRVVLLEFGQIFDMISVLLERWVGVIDLTFSDPFLRFEQFEIDEVDEGDLLAGDVVFAMFLHVLDNRLAPLENHFSDVLSWSAGVTRHSSIPLEVSDDARHHLYMSIVLRIVNMEEFWFVLGSDVAHDST